MESQFSLTFDGGDAIRNRLDFYDASTSYRGFARTLAVLGHYYQTGEIISKAPASSVKIYILPSEPGSFKQQVAATVVGGIIVAPFAGFAGAVFSNWLPSHNPQTQRVIDLLEEQNRMLRPVDFEHKKEPIITEDHIQECAIHIENNKEKFQAMRGILAGSVQDIFRPVGRSANFATVGVGCNNKPIRTMDERMVSMLRLDEVDINMSATKGTIDTYAHRSRRGYFWDQDLDRGIPFEYDGSSKLSAENDFSWSLHKRKPILINGRYVRWFDGKVKKMLVRSTVRNEDE